jgi:rSAM/selenodomain-associated transferase 2
MDFSWHKNVFFPGREQRHNLTKKPLNKALTVKFHKSESYFYVFLLIREPLMVSIIIPVLNEEKSIAAVLENLMGQEGDYEIIIADGGSTDDTLAKCISYRDIKIVTSEKGRAIQMNKGAGIAQGTTLLFLHADTTLPEKGIQAIEKAMGDNKIQGGSFYVKFDDQSRILNFLSGFTRINNRYLTWGDQGIFIRKTTFIEIGGYKDIPIMEDLEIQKVLRRKGRFVKLPLAVTTSARRFIKNGIIRQQLLNVALVMAYEAGVSPRRIKEFYSD